MNLLQKYEAALIERYVAENAIPEFCPGDTIRVSFEIIEGANRRVQAFEGVCIARKNRGMGSSFTVRKISSGHGIERIFPLYSPKIKKLEVVRRGRVRRAKLYYLRELSGKAARIKERSVHRAN